MIKYTLQDHIKILQDSDSSIVMNNITGEVMSVSSKMVNLLEFIKQPRTYGELITYFEQHTSRDNNSDEMAQDAINLLKDYSLLKML